MRRNKDRLKGTLKKKKKTPDAKQGGGRAKPADNKPFYASLFSHNPAVPELGLPESGEPSQPDVFSGESFSDLQLHPHLVSTAGAAPAAGRGSHVGVIRWAVQSLIPLQWWVDRLTLVYNYGVMLIVFRFLALSRLLLDMCL